MEPGYRDVGALLNKAQADQARAEQVATLLAQGEEYLGRGKWAQAAKAYRQVLALVPDHPEAVARLAEAERQEQVTKLYTAAQGHLEAGRWSEAIEGLRAVLELEPTHDEAVKQLAEAQAQLERQEVEEHARREEEARQAELARLYTVADEAAQAENWSKAIESFQAVLRLDASYRDAPTRLAQAEEVLVTEEAARQREAQLADLYQKATDRIQARDWPGAEQLLREIRHVDSSYRDVKKLLKQVASEQEREQRLAALYDGAEEHYRKEEWGQAVELYGQVLALEPGYRDIEAKLVEAQRQHHLADQYAQALEDLQAERWQEAIEGFEAVVEVDPTYKDAAALLTEAKHQKELASLPKPPEEKKKPPKPVGLPEEIKPPHRIRPEEQRAKRLKLGQLYREGREAANQGDWEVAIERFGQVVELDASYGDAAYRLAEVEKRRAEVERQKLLADLYQRALEHFRAERWSEAIEGFKAVLETDPIYKDTAARLAEAKHQKEIASLPKPPTKSPAEKAKPPGLPEEIRPPRKGKPPKKEKPLKPVGLPEEIKPPRKKKPRGLPK